MSVFTLYQEGQIAAKKINKYIFFHSPLIWNIYSLVLYRKSLPTYKIDSATYFFFVFVRFLVHIKFSFLWKLKVMISDFVAVLSDSWHHGRWLFCFVPSNAFLHWAVRDNRPMTAARAPICIRGTQNRILDTRTSTRLQDLF